VGGSDPPTHTTTKTVTHCDIQFNASLDGIHSQLELLKEIDIRIVVLGTKHNDRSALLVVRAWYEDLAHFQPMMDCGNIQAADIQLITPKLVANPYQTVQHSV
jgi:hypothetical protein